MQISSLRPAIRDHHIKSGSCTCWNARYILSTSEKRTCSTGRPLTSRIVSWSHPTKNGFTSTTRPGGNQSQPTLQPTRPKRWPGSSPTVEPKTIVSNMPTLYKSTSMSTSTAVVEPRIVQDIAATIVWISCRPNTNSIWPSRTRIAETTSPRNFMSMDLGRF